MRDRLLVRPRIRSDEWLDGYLGRILVANGLPRECRTSIHLQRIHTDVDLQYHVAQSARAPASTTLGRHAVPAWSCVAVRSAARFCPMCWQEAPYYRSEWRLSDSSGCWRHGCEYRSQCPACKVDLDVHDVCAGACRRGHNLTAAQPGIDTSAWPRLVTGAADLTHASEEVVASYLLLTRLAAQIARRSRRDSGNAGRSFGILIGATDGRPAVLDEATVRAALVQLPAGLGATAALRLILSAHRDELVRETVLSCLPLWEFAGLLIARGASFLCSIRDGLIDRHAVVFAGAKGDLRGREFWPTGFGASGVGDVVLTDSAHLQAPLGHLRLRALDEWKTRQAMPPQPIAQGAAVFMSPCELEDYLGDLSRVAQPLAECRKATVPLSMPQLWAGVPRPALIDTFNEMRSGLLSVWERSDRVGIARFHVGIDVLRRLRPRVRPSPSAPTAVQIGLPLRVRGRRGSPAMAS